MKKISEHKISIFIILLISIISLLIAITGTYNLNLENIEKVIVPCYDKAGNKIINLKCNGYPPNIQKQITNYAEIVILSSIFMILSLSELYLIMNKSYQK